MVIIQIFGMGHVGSLLAYRCACEFDSLVYINDIDKEKLQSEEADLQQACLVEHLPSEVRLSNMVEEADIYVICANAPKKASAPDDRMELLAANAPIVMDIAHEIAKVRKEMSMTLIITNPSHTLAAEALDIIPFAVPTGNLLDNARLRMCRATGQHERPSIQEKYDLVKSGKGYTQFGAISEAVVYIRGYINGLESP